MPETNEPAADAIDRGPRVGVPGGAKILRPKVTLETPLSEAEKAKFTGLLGAAKAPSGAAERIALVVDDDPNVRKQCGYAVRRLGLAMGETGDGTAALRGLTTKRISLLVLDLGIPTMDGYEVLRGVRNYLGLRDLTVFVLADSGNPLDELLSLNMGADGFLFKPFKPDKLEAYLRAALRARGVAVEPPAKVDPSKPPPANTPTLGGASKPGV